jgi:hypothetical protein
MNRRHLFGGKKLPRADEVRSLRCYYVTAEQWRPAPRARMGKRRYVCVMRAYVTGRAGRCCF